MTEATNNGTDTIPVTVEAPPVVPSDNSPAAAVAALASGAAAAAAAALAPGDRTCGVCGESGHNRRTCPRVAHEGGKVDKDGQRACSICGQPGHNKRTCPRLSGEEAEKAKAALSMAGFAPTVGANSQHSSVVQAFAIATGLMQNPGMPGRVLPVSVGSQDGKDGEGVSKEVEEALARRNNAEASAVKAEEEADLAEAKLDAARKRKADAEAKLKELQDKA
eukprot:CAMPEP_0196735314 /NCGR_PEP_ID=MMETSP1091-20130531/13796_1 /TAXON_ID=302021 /ORGANISM="Rhodomonas sp., Strain CCMP768" /LENGTH=220 /DNA_ID=CAMNT_0042078943 /DNA_START=98 /DNA_END=760 /DNA_ORIENTATION=+